MVFVEFMRFISTLTCITFFSMSNIKISVISEIFQHQNDSAFKDEVFSLKQMQMST